jgi:beta-1,4-N-acetylglucosaminyltransferase
LSTFVSVGNAIQPFGRLIDAVTRIRQQLPAPLVIQHGHTPLQASTEYTASPFMNMDEFAEQMASSDLLILHAGAGSLIHALQAGKVPVVMPRRAVFGEHIDDHQLDLSRALEREQRIVVVSQPECLLDAVSQAMSAQQQLKVRSKQIPEIVKQVSSLFESIAANKKFN